MYRDAKPIYIIIYKNVDWLKEFVKKRLSVTINWEKDINELKFNYFNVHFVDYYYLENIDFNFGQIFGIIIENNIGITETILQEKLIPSTIRNPFYGFIHEVGEFAGEWWETNKIK